MIFQAASISPADSRCVLNASAGWWVVGAISRDLLGNSSRDEFPSKIIRVQLHFGWRSDYFFCGESRADAVRADPRAPRKNRGNAFCGKIEDCQRQIYGRPSNHGAGTPGKTLESSQESFKR